MCSRKAILFSGLLAGGLGVLFSVAGCGQPTTPPPRSQPTAASSAEKKLTSPRGNVRPELPRSESGDGHAATYVGKAVCAGCHRPEAEKHDHSGHARTFLASRLSPQARELDGKTVIDPERGTSFTYHFHPEQGLSVSLPQQGNRTISLQYALGSATHAVTFLGLWNSAEPGQAEQTRGLEHRISVFPGAKQQRWNLSPGHAGKKAEGRWGEFGIEQDSAAVAACIHCHNTTAQVERGQLTNLRENVLCEKCHGPGSRHVSAAEAGSTHPRELQFLPENYTAEQQVEMCGRCHRVPEMVDTRLIRREEAFITRFPPVGLKQSRCFKESTKRISCTFCHDPHAPASHDEKWYAARCLQCHTPAGGEATACPVSPDVNCIHCHMPAVPSVHEVAFTDHWIRVRDRRDPQPPYAIPAPRRERP